MDYDKANYVITVWRRTKRKIQGVSKVTYHYITEKHHDNNCISQGIMLTFIVAKYIFIITKTVFISNVVNCHFMTS